ncbi:MAG: DUF3833 family protein [Pseudomonadota bacterium]
MPNDMSPTGAAEFDLFGRFQGTCQAWGLFEDRSGAPKRSFEVTTTGRYTSPTTFELAEAFTYDDGEIETRVWKFQEKAEGVWTGTCAECVGEADVRVFETYATMTYTFRLQLKTRTIDLRFCDRFYPIGKSAVMNRTDVTKFGLRVGQVSALFARADAAKTGERGHVNASHVAA